LGGIQTTANLSLLWCRSGRCAKLHAGSGRGNGGSRTGRRKECAGEARTIMDHACLRSPSWLGDAGRGGLGFGFSNGVGGGFLGKGHMGIPSNAATVPSGHGMPARGGHARLLLLKLKHAYAEPCAYICTFNCAFVKLFNAVKNCKKKKRLRTPSPPV